MQTGGMRSWLMHLDNRKKSYAPALVLTTLAFFSCAAIFLSVPAGAQKIKQLPPPPPAPRYKPKPTPTPEYEIVRVSSNLVMAPVSVTDAKGQPVLGLKSGDFRVEEDGRAQEIVQIGDPEQVPLDIAMLIDVSGSVVARFGFEQQAAARFLQQVLKPEDRATIFAIDQIPRQVQQLTTSQAASQSLMTVKPSNSYTAYFDSVLAAAGYLDKASTTGRRRIAVSISDGDDTARILNVSQVDGQVKLIGTDAQTQLVQKAVLDTLRDVQRAEVTFYSINPSGQTLHLNVRSARAEVGLDRIATATCGAAGVP